jgi:CBS domain-containing protein
MAKKTLARDVMRTPVRQLTAWTPVRDAAAFLLRQGISGAPVIDEHGQWVGVFTQNDIARYVQNRLVPSAADRTLEARGAPDLPFSSTDRFGETPVREFMTAGLFSVFPESTFEEVIHALSAFKVHRVFVIEERKGALLGVITTMDVLRHLDQQSGRSGKSSRLVRT